MPAHNQASRVRLQPFKCEGPGREIPAARAPPSLLPAKQYSTLSVQLPSFCGVSLNTVLALLMPPCAVVSSAQLADL